MSSVVTVAGICNSVGGVVYLTCHCRGGAGSKYRSVSRLGLLIGNRWMSRLVVLECANCSLHATVEGALGETVVTVSLSTAPRLRMRVGKRKGWGGEGQAVSPPTDLAVRSRSCRNQMTLLK